MCPPPFSRASVACTARIDTTRRGRSPATPAAWQQVTGDLDELIGAGEIQPMGVVMPDAPWSDRGSWYTDSLYTGDATGAGAGTAVETAFTRDLVEHVDATYRTVEDREARAVGGYSMGGAGALRFTLAHQDTFSAGIVLSPAVYVPQPPADSSARDHGGYGVGTAPFDADRYTELSYPTALAALDPALPVHLFVAVGDDEWANPDPAEATHDIDFESARLYNQARRVPVGKPSRSIPRVVMFSPICPEATSKPAIRNSSCSSAWIR